MSTFWSWYVSLLTIGTLLALLWLVFATRKGEKKGTTEQTMGHAFDGIEEYDNPLPKWWFMLFVGTILFAVVYLALYPGLGNWKGLLPGYEDGWTQDKQWQKEVDKADALYGPLYAKYAAMPLAEVAQDGQALKMGGRLFSTYCSICHGSDAKGAAGFPNLSDSNWRWGGEPETIKASILHGRDRGHAGLGQQHWRGRSEERCRVCAPLPGRAYPCRRATRPICRPDNACSAAPVRSATARKARAWPHWGRQT